MSFWEFFIVILVGLIVLGPERLPAVARTVGVWVAKARSTLTDVRDEFEKQLKIDELKENIEKAEKIEKIEKAEKEE